MPDGLAARIGAERLIEQVHHRSDLRLQPLGYLPGGEVGAALVALPSGAPAVLSAWSGTPGDRALLVGNIVARLRDRGYPAPKYLAIIDCGEATAVVQELVNREPAGEVGVPLARCLLNMNSMQRDALADAGGSLADLCLTSDGPGYCLHEAPPLTPHSSTARPHPTGRSGRAGELHHRHRHRRRTRRLPPR